MSHGSSNGPLLLYDGTCGFCAASVQFVLRRERRQTLRFAALQSDAGRAVRARHPELADVDSMIWVDAPGEAAERVLIRSDAVLRIGRYLGGAWRLSAIGRAVPRPLRDAAYDLLARHRHRLGAAPGQCYWPSPDVRRRFVATLPAGSREQGAGDRAASETRPAALSNKPSP